MGSKTKEKIVNSYLRLINDDEYDKVSVTDLVERCNISRQTFYYHFDDMNEMISWAFEQEIEQSCAAIADSSSLLEANEHNIKAMERFTQIIRKSTRSEDIVFIYSVLQDCASKFLKAYLRQKSKFNHINEIEFIIDSWAYAVAARIVEEAIKDDPDYTGLATTNYNKILESFASLR